MGKDNPRHKPKAKKAKKLARRKARRDSYDKVLIVCEGKKNEPCYFNGLKDLYRLNSANVEVCGECSSDPSRIVKYADKRYRKAKRADDPFDRVYCVFDKDSHTNYQPALNEIKHKNAKRKNAKHKNAKHKDAFYAVNSVPCFEYWLLLHFTYSTSPYDALPGKSACDQVVANLKEHLPNYKKGADIFPELKDHLDTAIKNAERALREVKKAGADNPTTRVHELVEYLQKLKS